MFQTIRLILYANKISNKYNKLDTINKIDAEIASQKFFVRFSYKSKYISHNNYYEWSKRLDEIGKEVLDGTYKFSEYFEFTIYEPKERKIKTLAYRDRVVQTWYVENFMKPYFLPQFIQDSYACIEGKGTHKAVDKMQEYLRKADKKYEEVWVLKCDISKFFFNINRDILFNLIKRKIKDKHFLEFTKKIIFYDEEKVGIPIGNYTSQFFANIYMNELDRYIKEVLKIEFVIRYMDDFVLLLKSKKEARQTLEKIELPYITACINSWKGHSKHCNSYNLVNKMLNEFVLKR